MTELKDVPCGAKIRPFRDNTEVMCHFDEHSSDMKHMSTLKNYAYKGSSSNIYWLEKDRRTFRGDWASCEYTNCVLPNEHRGNHAF